MNKDTLARARDIATEVVLDYVQYARRAACYGGVMPPADAWSAVHGRVVARLPRDAVGRLGRHVVGAAMDVVRESWAREYPRIRAAAEECQRSQAEDDRRAQSAVRTIIDLIAQGKLHPDDQVAPVWDDRGACLGVMVRGRGHRIVRP
jgi:hypothetical protein